MRYYLQANVAVQLPRSLRQLASCWLAASGQAVTSPVATFLKISDPVETEVLRRAYSPHTPIEETPAWQLLR